MDKVDIDKEHNPETAFFWASFAIKDGQRKKHCPTVTLYRNSEGKFFAVEASPGIDPTRVELVKDPWEWLQEEINRLKGHLP